MTEEIDPNQSDPPPSDKKGRGSNALSGYFSEPSYRKNSHPSIEVSKGLKSISVDDVYSNLNKDKKPTSISVEDAYKNNVEMPAPGSEPRKSIGKVDPADVHEQNKWLAAPQFTKPDVEDHKKNYLGDAIVRDDNDVFYKGEGDKWEPTNRKNHVILRDPEDGKFKIYKRTEDTDYGPIMGRLVGLGNVVQEGFQGSSVSGRATTAGKQTLQAADRLSETTGVEVPVSKAQIATGVEKKAGSVVSQLPGGKGPMERAASNTQNAMSEAASSTAELPTGGVAVSAADAGDTAKTAISKYIAPPSQKGILSGKVSEAYDKVDPFISKTATHPLTKTLEASSKIQQEFEAMGKTDPKDYSPAVAEILGAVTDPKGLTYPGLKRLRSVVRNLIDEGTLTDVENGALKQIHTGLTKDLKELISTNGSSKALSLWERANDYARLAGERKLQLSKILGSTTKSEEGVFGNIIKYAGSTSTADLRKLALARKSMSSSEWADITSATIDRMGHVPHGNESVFSIDKFMRDYGKLSPGGKNILFGESTAHRKALDSIATISESWPQMAHAATPSGEVKHMAGMFGIVHKPVEFLSATLGFNRWSNILAKPATAESVARWMEGAKLMTLKPTKGNVTVFNQASRALAGDLAREEGGDTGKAASLAKEYATKIIDASGVGQMWDNRLKAVGFK